MIGWLLDTNVVSTIINPKGAPTVKAWAAAQDEGRVFLSILTLGEYDKGIHNVPDDHPGRSRFIAARDGFKRAEQVCRRLVEASTEEISFANRGQIHCHAVTRAEAQEGLKMLDRETGLAGKDPEHTAPVPTGSEARVEG